MHTPNISLSRFFVKSFTHSPLKHSLTHHHPCLTLFRKLYYSLSFKISLHLTLFTIRLSLIPSNSFTQHHPFSCLPYVHTFTICSLSLARVFHSLSCIHSLADYHSHLSLSPSRCHSQNVSPTLSPSFVFYTILVPSSSFI